MVEQSMTCKGYKIDLAALFIIGFILAACGPLYGFEFLSDDPMETKVKTAPPNIMFVLDNSGSMDWEFIAPESDGLFHSDRYLFDNSDNYYSDSYIIDEYHKIEWISQWSGYNNLYYNQHSTYEPWPRWTVLDGTDKTGLTGNGDADLINPRSNPVLSSSTKNIHGVYYAGLPTTFGVIVDDKDGAPSYVEYGTGGIAGGNWANSSLVPEWGGESRYTGVEGEYAVFTPEIPATDNYEIYAFINCYSARDRSALVELDIDGDGRADVSADWDQRSTLDNVPQTGVCGEWVPMFGGSSYLLNQGSQAAVTIRRDTPDGGSTVADAIAFVIAGNGVSSGTVDVRIAHYYTVDDRNNNSQPDRNEIYLVNFVWTDMDSDGELDESELVREYYQVFVSDGDGDSYDEVEYVQEVSPVNVPDTIIPKFINEDGTGTAKTALEDLQNFANWFSFYRRRELTAKAAISRTINDLNNVYIGYYTINSGLRQTVLPVNVVENVSEIISDNKDNTFSRGSGWYESGSPYEYEGSAYYTGGSGNWAKFSPEVYADGTYEVQAWWNCYNSRDQKAKITIHHDGGDTVKYYNQRASGGAVTYSADCTDPVGAGCCGHWVDLGSYSFTAGTSGYVKIERHSGSTGGSTVADAVRFRNGPIIAATRNDSDDLLDKLYGVNSEGSTPLRSALDNVGHYFDQDDGNDGNLGTSPYYSEADGGACQQTYAIAMTDGYWNGVSPGVGNADGGQGEPFQDSYADTLADVAWKYYATDLAAGLSDDVGISGADQRSTQHMVTYGISFGLDGEIDPDDVDGDGSDDCPSWKNYCTDNGNSYIPDPYFTGPTTVKPLWGDPNDNCYACSKKIDDLWHASVNGHGLFYSAKNPDQLVNSLTELFNDIELKGASGASVSVNGDELTSDTALFQSSYESGSWKGNVTSYAIDVDTGQVLRDESHINWNAQEKLQDLGWNNRRIITYNGTSGVNFAYEALTDNQKVALFHNYNLVEYLRGREITGFRSRNKILGDIVHSAPLLVPAVEGYDQIDNDGDGDIDESDEKKGVVFAGGNDGYLHAFDADTGVEKMAYMPHHVFYNIHALSEIQYEHKFFADATPTYKRMNFWAGDQSNDSVDNDGDGLVDQADLDENYSDGIDNDNDGLTDEAWEYKKVTMLVGGLNKGGKGIYALDVTDVQSVDTNTDESALAAATVMWEYPAVPVYTYSGDQSNDGMDNDNDGCFDDNRNINFPDPSLYTQCDGLDNDGDTQIDETDECPYFCDENADGINEDFSDGIDNDEDTDTDEAGELGYSGSDDDMGYSYSTPFIVKSHKSYNMMYDSADSPWIVVFGNGYESVNGSAVLYVLDALTGTLLRKIDTGVTGNNGLSQTAVIDTDNDGRVNFVYAGDLMGNMWKFDLSDPDPEQWGVAFGTNYSTETNKKRIDGADNDGTNHDIPMPLFSSGQPITTAPDVMHHPEHDKKGFMVIFGTGKFFGEGDRVDKSQQTIYGIWDYGRTYRELYLLDPDVGEAPDYLGTLEVDNTISNLSYADSMEDPQLLEQTEVDFRRYGEGTAHEAFLRTLSDHEIHWYQDCSGTPAVCRPVSYPSYRNDGADNNLNGKIDESGEEVGHVGWYFNLPFDYGNDFLDNDQDGTVDESDEEGPAGERVIKNLFIRNGRAVVLSLIPNDSMCSGGGNSILHEIDGASGGRVSPRKPSFDINGDGHIDLDDRIDIDTDGDGVDDTTVAPTGRMYEGILHTPVVVSDPSNPRELKIFSTSAGSTEIMWEQKEAEGAFYWRKR